MNIRKMKYLIFFVLFTVLCLPDIQPVKAWGQTPQTEETAASRRKTVKVGFPYQKNITEKNEEGSYAGYTADYLNEVVKYTDWKIEYVEVEGDINTQLAALGDMLDTGEIDMLGMMNISDYLQELYLYPSYSYGNTYTALTVAQDSSFWQTDDFRNWNGMRVASCPALERRMKQLEQFSLISGFTYEIIEYEDVDEAIDAVLRGEADAVLQVDISIHEDLRSIARFNPSPYYFALTKSRTDLLKDLNSAMATILEAYPSLQSELYGRYFLHKDNFQLSEEDHRWIESLKPLKVLYFTGNAPVTDMEDDQPSGIAASFIESLSEATGLKTEPVFVSSYEEASRLVEEHAIDLIASMPTTGRLDSDVHLRLSIPYFESSAVWVTKGSFDVEDEKDEFLCANTSRELNVLKKNTQKSSLLDAYCVSYYLRKHTIYDGLYVEWTDKETILYAVGIMPSVDSRMVNILNGFANSLSEQTKQNMLYTNSRTPVKYTLPEKIELYREAIITFAAAVLILGLLLSRIRHNRILRENADEIERLHQFSLMLNECLIKYDIKRDQLIMQNNKFVFPDREIMQPFLEEGADIGECNDNERRYVERLREMLRNQLISSELELFYEDQPRWFRIDLAYVNDYYTIGRLSDINKEVRQRSLLEHKASHDALTGMMNRTAMQHHIDDYLSQHKKGAFLLLDLDNFKKVNDTLGHREGDQVLQKFAAFLDLNFRAEDCKGRLGGDEFVVFLPLHTDDPRPETMLSEKLDIFLRNISRQVFADYSSCELSVSIGAAFVSEKHQTFQELYLEADSAMYVAKYGGKNGYFISDGSTCIRKQCENCRDDCKKRDYLIAHGVTDSSFWRTSSSSPDKTAS